MKLSNEDKWALSELSAMYARYFDTGAAAEWADLFSPTGTFDVVGVAEHTGDQLAAVVAGRAVDKPGILHYTTNHVTFADSDDTAHGTAYVLVVRTPGDGSVRLMNLGTYEDTYVKLSGAWKFERRRFVSKMPPELRDAQIPLQTLSAATA